MTNNEHDAEQRRQRLLAHKQRLGWNQEVLTERLSEMAGEKVGLGTVRGWLARSGVTYSRACPAWPSALIERDYPSHDPDESGVAARAVLDELHAIRSKLEESGTRLSRIEYLLSGADNTSH